MLWYNYYSQLVLELLYPSTCIGCGEWGISFCEICRNKIEYIEKDACFYCNRVSLFGVTHENCKRPLGLDGVLAATYYTPVMKQIVAAIKYKFLYATCNDIFFGLNPLVMAKFRGCTRLWKPDLIQPLPLHPSRKRWRGFNQAELLSKEFQHISPVPVAHLLVRRKKTMPQARTSGRLERSYNIQNAFYLPEEYKKIVNGKAVIVVDDVITTGNTAKEAAKTLKQAGAKRVFVWSLARD